tara:strand:+ start:1529 stop:1942 length:414 start_codon:yes stop_codon:yes gene_type:complete
MKNYLQVKLFKLRKFLGVARVSGYVITTDKAYKLQHGANVVREIDNVINLRKNQRMFYIEHRVTRHTKPTIDRTNKYDFNWRGEYFVGMTPDGKFLQVNDGKHVEYYSNSFWNVYRIVSRPDAAGKVSDYIIHKVGA